ncbi:MAG TPA: hypothetical protein VIC27_10910 [Ktedonobacterales bacterium]|jgi:hypothetical protein
MWQAAMWEPVSGGDARLSVAAEQAQLARLRRQVDERWRAMALAHDRAARSQQPPVEALERLYDAYMRAVDAYVARQRALARPREAQRRAS